MQTKHNGRIVTQAKIGFAMFDERETTMLRNSVYEKLNSYNSAIGNLERAMRGNLTAAERDVARKHRDRLAAKGMNMARRLQRANILYGDS